MGNESVKLGFCLGELEAHGYVLVGEEPRRLIERVEGDVDIVVSRESSRHIKAILMELCRKLDLQCVQILQHEQSAFYFVVSWEGAEGWEYLRLDICDDYMRDGRLFMTAEELLSSQTVDEETGYYIPSPEKNLLYYLLKKIDKGAVDSAQFEYLCRKLRQCRKDVFSDLSYFWTADRVSQLLKVLSEENLERFVGMLPVLKLSLRKARRVSLHHCIGEALRIVKRVLRPTGVWIAIYGPDGCGKSSVIEALKPALLPAFRQTREFHFRPYLGYPKQSDAVTVSNPHGQKPRHPITSVLKLLYYAVDYIVGYITKVLPAKIRSALIVFDRYYDDLLVDQRRYCYGGPKWLLQAVRSLIPRPDLVFYLEAPPEVLQDRKKEVSYDECFRQCRAYRALVEKLSNGHIIDAAQPLNKVVNDIQTIVLHYLAERTQRRGGC